MAEILDMGKKRRELAAKRGFQKWSHRFSELFNEETLLQDLSDTTLERLIQPGEESSNAIYELIMGVQGLGPGPRFHFLEPSHKMALMDITLFLLDQFRFEAMKRLGWVSESPMAKVPLVDLVSQFEDRFSAERHQTPSLLPSHPRYEEYMTTFEGDRAAFIRKLIPEVLQCFHERVQKK